MNISCVRTLLRLRNHVSYRCASTSDSEGGIHKFAEDLKFRGLLLTSYPNDILTKCSSAMSSLPSSLYAGFDPTADSLHVGNLLVLLNLLRSSQFGCQPIALVGQATAAIGDPSGRATERDEISSNVVAENALKIFDLIKRIDVNISEIIGRESKTAVFNNMEWYANMSMIDYLRLCRPFRVGEMLRMGAIKSRMTDNDGISFTEFSYQTMQSYDWLHLAKERNCYFQIGGSDQLGHIDQGAHLIRRIKNEFAAGVCLPLVTDSAGNKLGKSTGAGIWLSAERTSPFHFYQFWRQLHDDDAESFLWKFSLNSIDKISQIIEDHRANLGRWVAQEALAHELTRIVHGKGGLETATRCSRALFHGSISDLELLGRDTVMSLFGSVIDVRRDDTKTMAALANCTRTDKQKGEVLMTKGAFKVNGNKFTDPSQSIEYSTMILKNTDDLTLICWGKRNYQLIRWI